MKNTDIYNNILTEEMKHTNINFAELHSHAGEMKDGLCHLCIYTGFQKYDIIVDPDSLEILGVNTEPFISDYNNNRYNRSCA